MKNQRKKNTEDFRQRTARPASQKQTRTVTSLPTTPAAEPMLGAVAFGNGPLSGRPERPQIGYLPRTGSELIKLTSNDILVDVDGDEDGMMFRFRWS